MEKNRFNDILGFNLWVRPWFVGAICLMSSSFWHLSNREYLLNEVPTMLRAKISVVSADDPSYLAAASNFLEYKEWKDNSVGKVAYVLRSPGYGMLAVLFFYLFGDTNGLFALICFQVLFWSLAVSFIPLLSSLLGLNRKTAYLLSYFVALMPMFSGFLSYTLTEGLTPSLVLLFYTALFYSVKVDRKYFILSGLLLGFCFLIRPALLVLIFSYLPFIKGSFKSVSLAMVCALLPLLIWQTRVQRITGDFDLHPIYQPDAADLYRPLHSAIWDFHKMTGQTGFEFHATVKQLWLASRNEMSKHKSVQNVVSSLHPSVLESIDEAELQTFYSNYVDILKSQQPYFDSRTPILDSIKGEESLIIQARKLRSQYVLDHLFRACVIVPLEVLKKATVHSNLSMYIFQKTLRGNLLIEFLRWLSLITHVSIFALAVFGLLICRDPRNYSLLIPGVVFLLYLIFVQRGIEERYMLPFLTPLLLVSISTIRALNLSIRNLSENSIQ